MGKKVYITKNYIQETEISEIDFDLYDKVLGKEWEDMDCDQERIELGRKEKWWTGESHPIEIDRIIKLLNNLKIKGANFVEIMYHCDHIGYVFNGVDIHKSTEGEIENHLDQLKKRKEAEKQKEIEALEKKLKQLKS